MNLAVPVTMRLAALALTILASVLFACISGPYPMTPGDIFSALLAGPNAANDTATVIWKLRLFASRLLHQRLHLTPRRLDLR